MSRFCPNGHEVSDEVRFCPQCGAEIQENVAEDVRFCKKCGQERKGAEKFCSHCGTPYYGNQDVNSVSPKAVGEFALGYFNKKTMYLLIIAILLIGGYFVYNHIQEEKRLEKMRAEENERAAEEERKRIEEEENPAKKLYKIAQNGNWGWGYMFSKPYSPGFKSDSRKLLYTQFVFLYPISETTGKLSYLIFTENSFSDHCGYQKLTSVYSIEDNLLRATMQSFNGYEGKFVHSGDNIIFRIENAGDKVNLIELGNSKNFTWSQMEPYTQNGKKFKDPLK